MINVYFFAAARAAAGQNNQSIQPTELGTGAVTIEALTDFLGTHYQGRTPSGLTLAQVLQQCSFLINGVRAEATTEIPNDARVDVLPPFAGG